MDLMVAIKFEKREGMSSWAVDHFKYITKKNKALDAFGFYLLLSLYNMHPDYIKQDVLILTSSEDHLIPFKFHDMQLKALVKTKSVTDRVFLKKGNAHNHYQLGNIKLSLKTIVEGIKKKAVTMAILMQNLVQF